jgi:hypothetical protein
VDRARIAIPAGPGDELQVKTWRRGVRAEGAGADRDVGDAAVVEKQARRVEPDDADAFDHRIAVAARPVRAPRARGEGRAAPDVETGELQGRRRREDRAERPGAGKTGQLAGVEDGRDHGGAPIDDGRAGLDGHRFLEGGRAERDVVHGRRHARLTTTSSHRSVSKPGNAKVSM